MARLTPSDARRGLLAWAGTLAPKTGRARVSVTHPALLRVPGLNALPNVDLVWSPFGPARGAEAVLGWGQKPTGRKALAWGARHGLPVLLAEEGFLKGIGREDGALQLLIDGTGGVHYDPAGTSCIDAALEAAGTPEVRARARAVMDAIRQHGLSKLNARRDPASLPQRPFVLVVDQVAGDASLAPSHATPKRFAAMLDATRATWPDHLIVVRTHPDHLDRGRAGHYGTLTPASNLLLHPGNDHPAAWLAAADHVVAMSSQMGFEALIHGTDVTCWGAPFYAARGLTRDLGAQPGHQRMPCDLEQLVGAALIVAPLSLNPSTGAVGQAEDVVDHLVAHRTALREDPATATTIGFSRRKARALERFMPGTRFVDAATAVQDPNAALVVWGAPPVPSNMDGRPTVRVEDGFLRSKGLGAAFAPAWSWTFDASGGIHYDPSRPSRVSQATLSWTGTPEQLASARAAADAVRMAGVTKYNLTERPPSFQASFQTNGRAIVLAVGQVEGDASLRLGGGSVITNAGLLEACRAAWPDAFLVYRPHPDVVSGVRPGDWRADGALADAVEPHAGTLALIEASDRVAVMTSQMGFEALLRGKPVSCWGAPFYAGWGLTEDRGPTAAGRAPRPLDALVWAVYVAAPRYIAPQTGCLVGWNAAVEGLRPGNAPLPGPLRRVRARVADVARRLKAAHKG